MICHTAIGTEGVMKGRGAKETSGFCDILFLGLGAGYTSVFICKNLSSCTLMICVLFCMYVIIF